MLDRANIFVLRDSGRRVSEIEDLIAPHIYLDALEAKFGRPFTESMFKDARKKWSHNFLEAASSLGLSGPPRGCAEGGESRCE